MKSRYSVWQTYALVLRQALKVGAKIGGSTPVKNYPGLGYAPTIAGLKKASKGGEKVKKMKR